MTELVVLQVPGIAVYTAQHMMFTTLCELHPVPWSVKAYLDGFDARGLRLKLQQK